MPSVFPELYNYSHVAPFLLRLAIGILFFASGLKGFFSAKARTEAGSIMPKIINSMEIVSGLFLLAGLFVQPVAMAASAILITGMIFKSETGFGGIHGQRWLSLFLLAILLSLVVLGPGIFSFDLPL